MPVLPADFQYPEWTDIHTYALIGLSELLKIVLPGKLLRGELTDDGFPREIPLAICTLPSGLVGLMRRCAFISKPRPTAALMKMLTLQWFLSTI